MLETFYYYFSLSFFSNISFEEISIYCHGILSCEEKCNGSSIVPYLFKSKQILYINHIHRCTQTIAYFMTKEKVMEGYCLGLLRLL